MHTVGVNKANHSFFSFFFCFFKNFLWIHCQGNFVQANLPRSFRPQYLGNSRVRNAHALTMNVNLALLSEIWTFPESQLSKCCYNITFK